MSTELRTREHKFSLNRFYGGKDDGSCVQVTERRSMDSFVTMTRAEALALAHDLMDFAAGAEIEHWD